jgi:hypothetical protein
MAYGSLRGKVAVYTAIFGAYDDYVAPPNGNYDCFLFADQKTVGQIQNPPGHVRIVRCENAAELPEGWDALCPTRRARYWKLRPHDERSPVSEYEYSLWIDGSISLEIDDLGVLIDRYLAYADIATLRHPWFDCTYASARFADQFNRDTPGVIERHLGRLAAAGYAPHRGAAETGVLIRRHTKKIAKLGDLWWSELQSGSLRDQVSFNYCVDSLDLTVRYMDDPRQSLGFLLRRHRGGR